MTFVGRLAGRSELDYANVDELVRQARASTGGIQALIARLDEPKWGARREVIAALAALGDSALVPLRESLEQDRQSETRIAATVDTLVASIGDAENAVLPLAASASSAVAADIAQILGRRRKARSVPTLVAFLSHADDNVAVAAIEALGRVGGRAAVDALVATVERGYFFRTYPAIDVLGRSRDPRAVAPLALLLRNPRYLVEAALALGRTADKSAVLPLLELLTSASDANVRVGAVALAELRDVHRTLYGNTAAVDNVLRQQAPEATLPRLTAALAGADEPESLAICVVLGALQLTAAAPLLARLLDGETKIANAAAAALERIGPAVDRYLHQAVLEGDSARRKVLLPLLPRTGDAAAAAHCLTDADADVRALACDALASLGDSSVVAALFERLKDPSVRVVQSALRAIQSLGTTQTETLALAAARSPELGTRRAALRVLAYFGYASAIDVFSEAMRDADARIRDIAIIGLALVEQPRAHALLLEAVIDARADVRTAAVRGLGQSTKTPEIVAALLSATADSEAWVRYYACQALGKLEAQGAAVAISSLLTDSAGQVRVAAIEALAQLKSPHSLAVLENAANSEDPDLKRAALVGLGVMKDAQAVPVVIAACSAAEPATRLVALSALSAFASDETLPVVANALADRDAGVRTAALGLLASWPYAAATPVLIAALHDSSDPNPIIQALVTPGHGRIAGILAALAQADDEFAPVLTSLLARVDPADHTSAVLSALQMPNPAARKAAAAMLAVRATREALAALALHAAEDPSDEVRRVCALLLAQ
ncbi:MAG: hypothetical protein RL701_28 [Pseudomonadota bacterium]